MLLKVDLLDELALCHCGKYSREITYRFVLSYDICISTHDHLTSLFWGLWDFLLCQGDETRAKTKRQGSKYTSKGLSPMTNFIQLRFTSKCSITSNSTGGWIRHLTYWALANIQVSNCNIVLRWENLFRFVMYIYSHKIHKVKWIVYEFFMWAKLPFLFNVFNCQLKIVLHLFNVCCICVCMCVFFVHACLQACMLQLIGEVKRQFIEVGSFFP